ncbi:MAG: hypothetical protein ACO1OB_20485 [Archangium sp.]
MIRRVVVVIVVLVLLLAAGFVIVPYVQAQSLGAQLATDVAALRETKWTRNPPVPNPLHDNGYQCFAAVLKVTPRDLSPFNINAPSKAPELAAWVRTHDPEPLETLPPELAERMQALSKWASQVRDCGNSRHLQLVPELEPWELPPRYIEVVMALTRYTSLEVRQLVAQGRAEEALNRCNATLAFTIDQSHQGLLGAVAATSSVRMLSTRCVEAWNALSPELRALTGSQWLTLATRLAGTREVLATERLCSGIMAFEPFAPHEGVPHPKDVSAPDTTWLPRFMMLRLWPVWDARTRELVDAADEPQKRQEISASIDALSEGWMMPPQYAGTANYEKFVERIAEGRAMLSTLQWISAGAKGEPPAGMRRVEGALEWKDSEGIARRIPLVQ